MIKYQILLVAVVWLVGAPVLRWMTKTIDKKTGRNESRLAMWMYHAVAVLSTIYLILWGYVNDWQ